MRMIPQIDGAGACLHATDAAAARGSDMSSRKPRPPPAAPLPHEAMLA